MKLSINMTKEDLLNYRIDNKSNNLGLKGNKNSEFILSKKVDLFLPEFFDFLNISYKNISKEFQLKYFRFDYLIKLQDESYLIIELKSSGKDSDFVSGLGQLLAYRTMLSCQYQIPIDNIKMALFINKDSTITLSTINDSNIPIVVCSVFDEGIKLYGKI